MTGERGREIKFNINSTPLQLYTDSEIGGGDVMWVRFTQSNSGIFAGISVKFDSRPSYHIGKCVKERKGIPKNKLGENKNRIWTIEKQETRLKLFCNGVEIFNHDTQTSSNELCRTHWSSDLDSFRFRDGDIGKKDTASDLYRQHITGNCLLSEINLQVTETGSMHNYDLHSMY